MDPGKIQSLRNVLRRPPLAHGDHFPLLSHRPASQLQQAAQPDRDLGGLGNGGSNHSLPALPACGKPINTRIEEAMRSAEARSVL